MLVGCWCWWGAGGEEGSPGNKTALAGRLLVQERNFGPTAMQWRSNKHRGGWGLVFCVPLRLPQRRSVAGMSAWVNYSPIPALLVLSYPPPRTSLLAHIHPHAHLTLVGAESPPKFKSSSKGPGIHKSREMAQYRLGTKYEHSGSETGFGGPAGLSSGR